jgi:heme/copper-type cytochrome/quinol oxidase subunit 2
LFLKVRVSVLVPVAASVEVVISESPGAERVCSAVAVVLVVVVVATVVFALVFVFVVVVPESEQPAARLANPSTPRPTINLIRTAITLPSVFRQFKLPFMGKHRASM